MVDIYALHMHCTIISWSAPGPACLARLRRRGGASAGRGLLAALSLDVPVQGVVRDLPSIADLERFDLTRGEQAEHERPAHAQQVRRLLDGVNERFGRGRRLPGAGGHDAPVLVRDHQGPVRGPARTT